MEAPPTKRLRGVGQELGADPFGDDDSFTQDDLDEIDVMVSQVATRGRSQGSPPPGGRSRGDPACSDQEVELLGNGQQGVADRQNYVSLLETQYEELRQKLGRVEQQMELRGGELCLLRDALRAAERQKEVQMETQRLLVETRNQEAHERERELHRKVQALQAELHFKEAEINEMKSKVVVWERGRKCCPLSRNSPRALNSVAELHHRNCDTSSPTGSGFITKETFGSQLAPRGMPTKNRTEPARSPGVSRQEVPRPDPFLSSGPSHHQGLSLLSLLLQPLTPSSVSLCQLLTARPSTLFSAGSPATTLQDWSTTHLPGSSAQSLALTALNLLTQNPTVRPAAAWTPHSRACPAALHLLPLVELYLQQLLLALDPLAPPHCGPSSGSGPGGGSGVSLEGSGAEEAELSPEEAGLAALRVLHLLLAHSDEVVEELLQPQEVDERGTVRPSQHALLCCTLQLCHVRTSACDQKEALQQLALRTLSVLLERSARSHTLRLQYSCWSQAVCVCVCAGAGLAVVSECVRILRCVADQEVQALQLCSQHESCAFLRLFEYIKTRADAQSREGQRGGTLLELQVVRLLSRLFTQRENTWTAFVQAACQCFNELVRVVVVILHRHWLVLRDSGSAATPPGPGCPAPRPRGPRPSLAVLKESLVLLHWLLLHHGSFHQGACAVLHVYDQAIPAVRQLLSRETLSYSEELALEEICRSEADDTEDMDTDAGS